MAEIRRLGPGSVQLGPKRRRQSVFGHPAPMSGTSHRRRHKHAGKVAKSSSHPIVWDQNLTWPSCSNNVVEAWVVSDTCSEMGGRGKRCKRPSCDTSRTSTQKDHALYTLAPCLSVRLVHLRSRRPTSAKNAHAVAPTPCAQRARLWISPHTNTPGPRPLGVRVRLASCPVSRVRRSLYAGPSQGRPSD